MRFSEPLLLQSLLAFQNNKSDHELDRNHLVRNVCRSPYLDSFTQRIQLLNDDIANMKRTAPHSIIHLQFFQSGNVHGGFVPDCRIENRSVTGQQASKLTSIPLKMALQLGQCKKQSFVVMPGEQHRRQVLCMGNVLLLFRLNKTWNCDIKTFHSSSSCRSQKLYQ